MPNLIHNTLIIGGPARILDIFKKKARTHATVLSFNNLVPIPEFGGNFNRLYTNEWAMRIAKQKIAEKYDEYDRMLFDTWGTNKEALAPRIKEDLPTRVVYQFYTAWAPPIELLKNVSEKFPSLLYHLKWYVEGAPRGERYYQGGDSKPSRNG